MKAVWEPLYHVGTKTVNSYFCLSAYFCLFLLATSETLVCSNRLLVIPGEELPAQIQISHYHVQRLLDSPSRSTPQSSFQPKRKQQEKIVRYSPAQAF